MDSFQQESQYVAYGSDPIDTDKMTPSTFNFIATDITTTFTLLIGIFFPSVTGKNKLFIKEK